MNLKAFSENLNNTINYFIQSFDDKMNDFDGHEFLSTMIELKYIVLAEYARAEKTNNKILTLYLENFLLSLDRLALMMKKTKDQKIIRPLVHELINSTQSTETLNPQYLKAIPAVGAIALGVVAVCLGFAAGAGLGLLLGLGFCCFVEVAFNLYIVSNLFLQIAAFIGGGLMAAAAGKSVYDTFNSITESSNPSLDMNHQVQKLGQFFSRRLENPEFGNTAMNEDSQKILAL